MLIGTDLELGRVDYTRKYITEEPDAVVPHAVQVTGRSTMTIAKQANMRVLIIMVLFMSGVASANADVWERKYFSKGFEPAFIFFAIYGIENSELNLSKTEHNIDEYPQGLDIRFYNKSKNSEQKAYIEGFLNGAMGRMLKEDSPELYKKTLTAQNMAIVSGMFDDVSSLKYLKNSIGVLKALSEKKAISILDVQTSKFFTPEEWSEKYFVPRSPSPFEHISLLYSDESDGIWLHSRGMRTFGMPDISLVGWPKDKISEAQEVANRFIEMYAYGAYPEGNKELVIKGLPAGMRTELKGNYENDDFNNYYIEIKWLN